MTTDAEELRTLLDNMHALDCEALDQEVLAYPDRCNCNVAPAVALFDRVMRYQTVATGDAPLDVVELTFDELNGKIETIKHAAEPVIEAWENNLSMRDMDTRVEKLRATL